MMVGVESVPLHGGPFGPIRTPNVCSFGSNSTSRNYHSNICTCSGRYRLQECSLCCGDWLRSQGILGNLLCWYKTASGWSEQAKAVCLVQDAVGGGTGEALAVKVPCLWKEVQWKANICGIWWENGMPGKEAVLLFTVCYSVSFGFCTKCNYYLPSSSQNVGQGLLGISKTHSRGNKCLPFSNYVSMWGWFFFIDFNQSNTSQQTRCRSSCGDSATFLPKMFSFWKI